MKIKGKNNVRKFSELLFIIIFLFPILSFILFSSCAKSLVDEGFPESSDRFTNINYDNFNMNKHYDSNDVNEYYVKREYGMYDRDIDSLINGMNEYNDYLPIRTLQYKILCNPSKRDKYEKEIQKIEQQFLDSRLNFLREFYTDLYQKNQKDFARQYKSRCSINIIHAMKFIYAKRHQGNKGYAWFIFGDNAKHDSSSLSYKYMGGNWFKVSLDTNTVMLQLDGTKKKKISIAQIVNRHLKIAIQ